MELIHEQKVSKDAIKLVLIEVKLHINRKLYEKGFITKEMYIKMKELILRE